MREIKFRAWDTKQGKWLFGYELPNLGGFSLTGEVVLLGEISSVPLTDWNHIEVMQFTGLKDKNGKDIYEGDIVAHTFSDKPEEVYFEEGAFSTYKGFSKSEVEIIGNIYENPELLTNQH